MGWAWLIMLLATYPWLLGADLASDAIVRMDLIFFVSGAVIVAPCRRLRRWQAVPFAAGVGFLFEARRTIPDGSVALSLVACAIFLTSHKPYLRHTPGVFRAAALCNLLVCLIWFLAAGLSQGDLRGAALLEYIPTMLIQGVLAAGLGVLSYIPISLTQNVVMDRMGIPPYNETT